MDQLHILRKSSLSDFIRSRYDPLEDISTCCINPFAANSDIEPGGGFLHFDGAVTRDDFMALMRLVGVPSRRRGYSASIAVAENAAEERFLEQMRIVSIRGLTRIFPSLPRDVYEEFPEQPLSIPEVLWAFIENQRARWIPMDLLGAFGGDDSAREELSFGFMVENMDFGIFRIWSRAWFLMK